MLDWLNAYGRYYSGKNRKGPAICLSVASAGGLQLQKFKEFSESLSGLLVRLEDMKYYRMADRAMSIS